MFIVLDIFLGRSICFKVCIFMYTCLVYVILFILLLFLVGFYVFDFLVSVLGFWNAILEDYWITFALKNKPKHRYMYLSRK